MRRLESFSLGLAFASAITAAQAQTVVSRQITNEQIETTITQDWNGTFLTRRTLHAEPAAPLYRRSGEIVETAEPPATRPYSRQAVRTQRWDVQMNQRTVTWPVARPMWLAPDGRRVYRAIEREQMYPAAPVETWQVVTTFAPHAVPLYPRVTGLSATVGPIVAAVDGYDSIDSYLAARSAGPRY